MKKMVEPTFCLLKTRNCVRNHLKKHDLGGLQRGDLVAGSEDLVHCTVAYEIKWNGPWIPCTICVINN